MTRKAPAAPADEPVTLTDADITSKRAVTRRTLLGALGIGTGLAAAATVGGLTPTSAADSSGDKDKKTKKKTTKKPPPKKPKEEADHD